MSYNNINKLTKKLLFYDFSWIYYYAFYLISDFLHPIPSILPTLFHPSSLYFFHHSFLSSFHHSIIPAFIPLLLSLPSFPPSHLHAFLNLSSHIFCFLYILLFPSTSMTSINLFASTLTCLYNHLTSLTLLLILLTSFTFIPLHIPSFTFHYLPLYSFTFFKPIFTFFYLLPPSITF